METDIQNILVTGSSGYLGRTLVHLLKDTFQVKGIDRFPAPTTDFIVDLRDRKQVEKACEKQHAIIHTAALHAPHVHTHSREEYIDTNVKGTLYLLEAALKQGIKRVIYSSSTSVYGNALVNPQEAVWVTETLAPRARDIYDITKLAAEGLCEDVFSPSKLVTLCLRISRFWQEPLPQKLWYRLYRGLDVRDAAAAHVQALSYPAEQFETFNISCDSPFSKEEMPMLLYAPHEIIERKAEKVIPFYREMKWPIPNSIDRVYVIDKAKTLLGFHPTYSYLHLMNDIREATQQEDSFS
ncbi:MAG: NAD(P)-dependent oxidoreductase [Bacteroidota bacterium]